MILIIFYAHGSMQLMDKKVTRRDMSLILGGLGIASAHAQSNKPSTTIHQEVDFQATPARIYEALLDAKRFSAFTKDTAEIQPQPGGTFKLFGGRIEGRNVELVPNQRIVQAWRPASWPAGVYSIVKFELVARGSGTRIVFDHAGFTEDKWEHLNEGWPRNYWEPLRKYIDM
jgi:activator of HSP90 ATPase